MSSLDVVLDACVLFPGSLRDTLLRASIAGLYTLHITDEIVEEMRRNLVENTSMGEIRAKRLVDTLKSELPNVFVSQYELFTPNMPLNEKDRHVLAAAVASNSRIIVTQNLKDFPLRLLKPFEVEAISADGFLMRLFEQNAETVVKIIVLQAEDLHNPPMTLLELLDRLKLFAPTFTELVHRRLETDLFR